MKICKKFDCQKKVHARQLCKYHYEVLRLTLIGPECSIDGCSKKQKAKGLCRLHYNKERLANANQCLVNDCEKLASTAGMCAMHYSRQNLAKKPKCQINNCQLKQYAHGICRRHYHVQLMFNLSPSEYNQMIDDQDNKCAICEEPPMPGNNVVSEYLYVDHDHKTGKVRGLLCHSCNAGLGHFRDEPDLLHKALAYLQTNTMRTALEA